ncbi:MAG: hypothetical protein ACFFBD_12300 [Candidatus Hodarchaeota archaeon]
MRITNFFHKLEPANILFLVGTCIGFILTFLPLLLFASTEMETYGELTKLGIGVTVYSWLVFEFREFFIGVVVFWKKLGDKRFIFS